MKYLTLAISTLILVSACARSPVTLPEITPDLKHETWLASEKTGALAGILSHDNHLFLIRTSGSILKIDPGSGNRVLTAQLPHPLRVGVIAGQGHALLRPTGSKDWILLDLNTLKEKFRINSLSPGSEIVTVGKQYLVFRSKDSLGIRGFASDPFIAELPLKPDDFRSCGIIGKKIFILLRDELVEFTPPDGSPRHHLLPFPACGGFLMRNGAIYYGSEDRRLVKWSPGAKSATWSKKLPRKLLLPPLDAGNRIAIAPQDQHIHFFSDRGGTGWWAPLDSTRLFPPILMKDNIVVFMYPAVSPAIRFFNWKTRQSISHTLDSQPIFPPVVAGGAVFCVTAPKGKHQVERILNRRGLNIELEPDFPLLPEHSLEFRITPFNLIKPEFHLKLLRNGEAEPLWKETLPRMESPSRAWLPRSPGQYTLEVEGKSMDGFSVTVRKSFTILNAAALIRNTLSRIHQACHGDKVAVGNTD